MHQRQAGILAHITSLPGRYGMGDLGPGTMAFLEWAASAGQRIWQLLPLGPTGPNASPYSSRSAFAGNPLLISPARLVERGWLAPETLTNAPATEGTQVDFERVIPWREHTLRTAWATFNTHATAADRSAFEAFTEAHEQRHWLDDWTLYSALKHQSGGQPWTAWDPALRERDHVALNKARIDLVEQIDYQRVLQFFFHDQWRDIKAHAHRLGISILGDVPFYLAHDSADVWSHPEIFMLDERGMPRTVAGVPPDYFSAEGQRWGNPLFDWEALARDDFSWWIDRLQSELLRFDWIRLDHFRAFSTYWEIDAAEPTAIVGRWRNGPGEAFFAHLKRRLGCLPLIAEDLGDLSADVHDLRDALVLPGMRILQFAFGAEPNEHLPERHPQNAVVYTGTHDNNTTRGWFDACPPHVQTDLLSRLETTQDGVVRRMIELAYHSPARLAIVPLQDLLELDASARMNIPGTSTGNWRWRATPEQFTIDLATRQMELARVAGRCP
jgi:4-alpha-glucanotransferase